MSAKKAFKPSGLQNRQSVWNHSISGVGTKPGLWTGLWTELWTQLWTHYGLNFGLYFGLNFGLYFGLGWTVNNVLELLFKEDFECCIAK